ncbi:MAG: DUF167 domain-containing protein [Betaproteobacteria bacterium]|nr:DUF167 domain-containing protein [Betaproteobacteria bacterium]
MSPDWLQFQASESRLTLQIHAQPNAKTTGAAGLHGDALKVRIAAPPADDRANTVLLAWLADALALPRGAIRLKAGHTSRRKIVEIRPATAATAARAATLIA